MRLFIATLTAALISTTAMAADIPAVPTPAKEHEWLKKLEGTWTLAGEGQMGGQTFQSKGTETVRSLGGFWIVSDLQCECAGAPMTGLMTVGYDTAKGKFVGTWVCSMCDHMCKYEGTLQGDVLTLNTEGPDPTTGKLVKMRDVLELKGDTRTLTSEAQGDDGKWVKFMSLTATRK